MKRICFGLMMAALCASAAAASDARMVRSLKRLDPDDRLMQICDITAMSEISRAAKGMRPDRAMINAISPPKIEGNVAKGDGGALRSKGLWYRFAFTCATRPDRLKVLKFTFKLGEPIPRQSWSTLGLWE